MAIPIETITQAASGVDQAIRESEVACACMDVEDLLQVCNDVFDWLWLWDRSVTEKTLTGQQSAEHYSVERLAEIYRVFTELHTRAIENAERFERKGYDVKYAAEVRARDFSELTTFALLQELQGSSTDGVPKHIREFADAHPIG